MIQSIIWANDNVERGLICILIVVKYSEQKIFWIFFEKENIWMIFSIHFHPQVQQAVKSHIERWRMMRSRRYSSGRRRMSRKLSVLTSVSEVPQNVSISFR